MNARTIQFATKGGRHSGVSAAQQFMKKLEGRTTEESGLTLKQLRKACPGISSTLGSVALLQLYTYGDLSRSHTHPYRYWRKP